MQFLKFTSIVLVCSAAINNSALAGNTAGAEAGEAARQRALNFFAAHADKYNVKNLTAVDAQGAGVEYFVFKSDDSNYYVVSSRAALPSVVAHSTSLDVITDTAGTAATFLKNYKEVVNNLSPTATLVDYQNVAISNWDCVVELTNVEVQAALLKTKWHQMAPYNKHCPIDGSGNQMLVGCVATAFSQVMNYFQYPPMGRGIYNPHQGNGYMIEVLPEGYLADRYLDLSKYPIRWDNMPEGESRPLEEYTPSEIDAVARFCEEVGYCMRMNYGTSTSDVASINFGLRHVKDSFDYQSDGYICYHDEKADNFETPRLHENYMKEFFNSLVDGINTPFEDKKKVPLVAQGQGHAFVVDGYMTGGYVNINFGWEENKGSGWYFISQLDPKIHGVHAQGGNYAIQYAIKGFVPAKTPLDPDVDILPDLLLTERGESVIITGLAPDAELEYYNQMGCKVGYQFADPSGTVTIIKLGLPTGLVTFKDVQTNRTLKAMIN